MNRNLGLIIGLIGIGAAAYYQSMRKTIEALTGKLNKISFDYDLTKNSFFTRLYFGVEVLINNPTSNPITVSSIYLSMFYNGRSVCNANKTESFNIKPGTSTVAIITVFIPTLSLYQNVQTAVNEISNGNPIDFNVVGGINIPAGTIKINQSFRLALR